MPKYRCIQEHIIQRVVLGSKPDSIISVREAKVYLAWKIPSEFLKYNPSVNYINSALGRGISLRSAWKLKSCSIKVIQPSGCSAVGSRIGVTRKTKIPLKFPWSPPLWYVLLRLLVLPRKIGWVLCLIIFVITCCCFFLVLFLFCIRTVFPVGLAYMVWGFCLLVPSFCNC